MLNGFVGEPMPVGSVYSSVLHLLKIPDSAGELDSV